MNAYVSGAAGEAEMFFGIMSRFAVYLRPLPCEAGCPGRERSDEGSHSLVVTVCSTAAGTEEVLLSDHQHCLPFQERLRVHFILP